MQNTLGFPYGDSLQTALELVGIPLRNALELIGIPCKTYSNQEEPGQHRDPYAQNTLRFPYGESLQTALELVGIPLRNALELRDLETSLAKPI